MGFKGSRILTFKPDGLPPWSLKCKECGRPAVTGGFKCISHLTSGRGIQEQTRKVCEKRYVAWVLTGMPEHRFADVAEEALWEFILERATITEEQMVKLAVAIAESIITPDPV